MKRKAITLRLDKPMHRFLNLVAKNSGVRFNDVVCVLLALGIMKHQAENPGLRRRAKR